MSKIEVVVLIVVILAFLILVGGASMQENQHNRDKEEYRIECFSSGIKEEKIIDGSVYYYLNDGGCWFLSDWNGWRQVAPPTRKANKDE